MVGWNELCNPAVDSEYQEIHPYSALNIDSVKINTSLLMMREWLALVSHMLVPS